jgi:hypothetical protein
LLVWGCDPACGQRVEPSRHSLFVVRYASCVMHCALRFMRQRAKVLYYDLADCEVCSELKACRQNKRGTEIRASLPIVRGSLLGSHTPYDGRLINPPEQSLRFLPIQLAVRVDLSAHPALADKHLLERISLVREPSTTFLTAGSCHKGPPKSPSC